MTNHEEARPASDGIGAMYPVIGETTTGLGEYLVRVGTLRNAEAYQRIRLDAINIVQRSRRFGDGNGTRTGLAVGYVQSGKTLSMMAVSALARDNGCRIIILLAGVTTVLLKQNANRFRTCLTAVIS